MQGNVKSCNQTQATEVQTEVMERTSVFLPAEVPPTAKAAATTYRGKSAEDLLPSRRGRAETVRCEKNRNRRETELEKGWHVSAQKCRLNGEPRRGTPEELYSYIPLTILIDWNE